MSAEYIFINPSPNMELVASYLASLGAGTQSVYLTDFAHAASSGNVWAYYGGSVQRLGSNPLPSDVSGDICSMKKPFFVSFSHRYVRDRLKAMSLDLAGGSFQDYVLLSGTFWQMPRKEVKLTAKSCEEVADKNPYSIIITSSYPQGHEKAYRTYWRTDYNIEEALGGDYFFFYTFEERYELYCKDGHLVCVSSDKGGIDWLKLVNPALRRFNFEKDKSESFYRNTHPWIQKVSPRVMLINDYSWHSASILLPDNWARSVGKFIYKDAQKVLKQL